MVFVFIKGSATLKKRICPTACMPNISVEKQCVLDLEAPLKTFGYTVLKKLPQRVLRER